MGPMYSPADLLSLPETARLLRVSEDTVRRWIKDKKLPAQRIGTWPHGRLRIRRTDAEALLVREQ